MLDNTALAVVPPKRIVTDYVFHFYINYEMYVVLSCLSQTGLHSLSFALSLQSQIKNSFGSEIY